MKTLSLWERESNQAIGATVREPVSPPSHHRFRDPGAAWVDVVRDDQP